MATPAGFVREAKKAVAEIVPTFCKKRRRFVAGMTVNLMIKSTEKVRTGARNKELYWLATLLNNKTKLKP